MIRRELQFTDGPPLWVLISQVDHARISGELMQNWREELPAEVVNAITHHDDGWADWESEAKINPAVGGPYSFLEMPIEEFLPIWDHSIAEARKFGPLAGYIVCSHFYKLLSDSDRANDPPAVAWLTAKRKVRTAWLDEWIRADPSHTLDYAKHAQQLLLTADLFSLWLCCDCPVDISPGAASSNGDDANKGILGNSAMKLRLDDLLSDFKFGTPECTVRESLSKKRVEGLSWIVPVEPCPFRAVPVAVSSRALAVPVAKYGSWHEVEAAGWQIELIWSLIAAT